MLAENIQAPLGLPGLKAIRMRLGLAQKKLAALSDISKTHLGQVEIGHADCSQATQRLLAKNLSCEVCDLHTKDLSEERLRAIEISYDEVQLQNKKNRNASLTGKEAGAA